MCQVTRTVTDFDLNSNTVVQGTFRYLRANQCWDLEMHAKKDPREFEKIVGIGKDLYVYAPQRKEIQKFQLPPGRSFADTTTDPFSVLFSGMSTAQTRERFDWKFVKEDAWYIYLGIEPRTHTDRVTFLSARLVLLKESHLPRQIWFQTSGQEATWDFTKLDTAAELKKEDFTPKVPEGWRIVSVGGNEVEPGRRNLGTIKVGEAVKMDVVLRAEKPFRVTGIQGPAEVTLVPESDDTPRKVHTVTLEYRPAKPGPFRCAVKFKTELEGEPMAVALEGTATP
jgi:TIGR03009 family protein